MPKISRGEGASNAALDLLPEAVEEQVEAPSPAPAEVELTVEGPVPGVTILEPDSAESDVEPAEMPARNASRDAWAQYAQDAYGVEVPETTTRGELIELYGGDED